MNLSEKRGDRVFTPEWVARDMVEHFKPTGAVLEPCKGAGVFMQFLPPETKWCEIDEGRDFFEWAEHVDWVVSNPPYSMTRRWFRHSYEVATNLLYLVPLRNIFSGFGFVREIYDFGGIVEIRIYGTGGSIGFPMGNAVGAFHIQSGYTGPTTISFAERPIAPRPRLVAKTPNPGLPARKRVHPRSLDGGDRDEHRAAPKRQEENLTERKR